jgi:hypothetical protein
MQGGHVVEVGELVLVAALEIGGLPAEEARQPGET